MAARDLLIGDGNTLSGDPSFSSVSQSITGTGTYTFNVTTFVDAAWDDNDELNFSLEWSLSEAQVDDIIGVVYRLVSIGVSLDGSTQVTGSALTHSRPVPVTNTAYYEKIADVAGEAGTSYDYIDTLEADHAVNATYTITGDAPPTGILLDYNGVYQESGVFYTISGSTLTFLKAAFEDDTIHIYSSAGEENQDSFKTIVVDGQTDVVADSATDTLTFVAR